VEELKLHSRTSIAEDVIKRKGLYGRFAEKWFSKRGWCAEKRRVQGMSAEDLPREAEQHNIDADNRREQSSKYATGGKSERMAKPDLMPSAVESQAQTVASTLLPKLLRTTKMLFSSSRSFFFSYDYDITRSLANQNAKPLDLPLCNLVDPLVRSCPIECYLNIQQSNRMRIVLLESSPCSAVYRCKSAFPSITLDAGLYRPEIIQHGTKLEK
jgi:hypothetical protein